MMKRQKIHDPMGLGGPWNDGSWHVAKELGDACDGWSVVLCHRAETGLEAVVIQKDDTTVLVGCLDDEDDTVDLSNPDAWYFLDACVQEYPETDRGGRDSALFRAVMAVLSEHDMLGDGWR